MLFTAHATRTDRIDDRLTGNAQHVHRFAHGHDRFGRQTALTRTRIRCAGAQMPQAAGQGNRLRLGGSRLNRAFRDAGAVHEIVSSTQRWQLLNAGRERTQSLIDRRVRPHQSRQKLLITLALRQACGDVQEEKPRLE